MLEHFGVPRRYHGGDIIFRQGSRGEEMYVVRSGKIRIFGVENGVETTFAILGKHDFFGEMSLLTGETRSASATAEGDVEVSVVDRATFNKLVGDPLIHDMLVRMSQRISSVDEELKRLSAHESIRREHLGHIMEQRHWFA